MPGHCEPCPGKTNTVLPTPAATGRSRPARPAVQSSASWPTTTERYSNAVRVARVWPTSTGFSPASGRSRSARAPTASGVRPDSSHGTTVAGGAAGAVAGGTDSMIACALVPLMPNDDTPARRGPFPSGHSRASVNSSTRPADQSMCGDGSSACRVLGSTPCRMANTILMTPATPAAAWVWPMLDFTEPSHSGSSRSWP